MKSASKKLKEEMSTGAGATFQCGQGEQNGSKYSWVGASKKNKKKIKESITYTPEKAEEIYKSAEKEYKDSYEYLKKYAATVVNTTFIDLIHSPEKGKKITNVYYQLSKKIEKTSNILYQISHSDGHEKFEDLSTKFDDLSDMACKIKDLVEDIEGNIERIHNNKELLTILK